MAALSVTPSNCAPGRNIIIGLNPALQRSINLGAPLTVGAVNRGTNVNIGIGGKGQDVLIAAHSMHAAELPLLAQFLGSGAEGDQLLTLLASLTLKSDPHYNPAQLTVRTSSRLRNAITLLNPPPADATEIVEPSGSILQSELQQLKSTFSNQFSNTPAPGVAVMGSMPPGCPTSYYCDLLSLCTSPQSKVLLDTLVNVHSTIAYLQGRVDSIYLKLNIRELMGLGGMKVSGSDAGKSSEDSLIAAAGKVVEGVTMQDTGGTRTFILATDGPFCAHLLEVALSPSTTGSSSTPWLKAQYRYTLPPLPSPVVNPIGAGDAAASGTLMALTHKVDVSSLGGSSVAGAVSGDSALMLAVTSFGWGLACGAASCLTASNSVLERTATEGVFRGIDVQRIV